MYNLQNNKNINSHFIQEIISENNSISSQKSNTRHTSIDQLSDQNSLDGEFNCSVCHELQTCNICFDCKCENICETCDGNGEQDGENGSWICQKCFEKKDANIQNNDNIIDQENRNNENETFIKSEHITL